MLKLAIELLAELGPTLAAAVPSLPDIGEFQARPDPIRTQFGRCRANVGPFCGRVRPKLGRPRYGQAPGATAPPFLHSTVHKKRRHGEEAWGATALVRQGPPIRPWHVCLKLDAMPHEPEAQAPALPPWDKGPELPTERPCLPRSRVLAVASRCHVKGQAYPQNTQPSPQHGHRHARQPAA